MEINGAIGLGLTMDDFDLHEVKPLTSTKLVLLCDVKLLSLPHNGCISLVNCFLDTRF